MKDRFNLGRTNYERVRDAIRNDIITGEFSPGSRLKISDLVERYGISAMPIREALQQLQGEGLIVFSANRGASIRPFDEHFLWQMYEIRKALEMFFVLELTARAGAADLERMQRVIVEQERAIAEGDESRLQDLDLEFHTHIVGATGNEEAVTLLSRQYDLTHALRVRFGRSREQYLRIPRDHRAIVQAIAQHDGVGAGRLISEHINTAFADLADAMRLGDTAIRQGRERA